MTIQEIDKIVCEWSMKYGIAMPEQAQVDLVDQLNSAFNPNLEEIDRYYINNPQAFVYT